MKTPAINVNDAMMEPAPPEMATNKEAQAQDLDDGGWCRIVEENPEA